MTEKDFPKTLLKLIKKFHKKMEDIKKDLPTLYTAARSAYEQEGDPDKARQLFQAVIDQYRGSDEAEYAAGFITAITDQQQGNDDAPKQQQDMQLAFSGKAKEYFRIWIVNLCLTLVTFGIFSAWAKVRKKRYFYSHLTLDRTPFQYLGQPIPILKGRLIAGALFLLYYLSNNLFIDLFPYVLETGSGWFNQVNSNPLFFQKYLLQT